jgi:heme/copper-type cytochrome/quinol oxidase subunit 2
MSQPLAETIFWIAVVACVVAEIAILRSTYVARRVEKSAMVPAAPARGEIVWAIIPALGLSVVFILTWQRIEARDAHMRMMDHSGMGSMSMPGMTAPASTR